MALQLLEQDRCEPLQAARSRARPSKALLHTASAPLLPTGTAARRPWHVDRRPLT
eukprot:CAMPEP_0115556522 /NCGR_PEP_ID=MMETSP0271-20121206/98413_1 /TAXON_ID=71861 /ORGANISM="Scrippsiella trochoidea, Strain CCMP3099" /LENGTH=54 /DNA_ID=CAMNT_0002990403 /DNA_START=90 /DNA_END=250 /DNA_ORIENTATION=-